MAYYPPPNFDVPAFNSADLTSNNVMMNQPMYPNMINPFINAVRNPGFHQFQTSNMPRIPPYMRHPNSGINQRHHVPPRFQYHPRNRCYNNWNNQKKKTNQFQAYCDVCDKGFKSAKQKEEHCLEHVKCQEATCEFRAHPKVVAKHWRTLHKSNGPKVDLNEDDEKWRANRRKNFPTLSRIKQKEEFEKDLAEKGAVLSSKTPQSKKLKAKEKRKRFQQKKSSAGFPSHLLQNKKDESNMEAVSTDPMSLIIAKENCFASDETKKEVKIADVKIEAGGKGLSSLVAAYSDSDSDVALHVNTSSETNPKALSSVKQTSTNSQTKKRNYTNESSNNHLSNKRKKENLKSSKVKSQNKSEKTVNPTLLKKLLQPQIDCERNNILQCIRFIVKNNFFDEPKEQEEMSNSTI